MEITYPYECARAHAEESGHPTIFFHDLDGFPAWTTYDQIDQEWFRNNVSHYEVIQPWPTSRCECCGEVAWDGPCACHTGDCPNCCWPWR